MTRNDQYKVVQFIESRAAPITKRAGELVFSQGDTAEEFYYLKSGIVRVYTITESGNERNILIAWPGRFFAASSFFNNHSRQTSAVVLKDAELLAVDPNLYAECIERLPGFQQLLLEELSQELFSMFEQLADVSLFDSTVNVARFICRRVSEVQLISGAECHVIEYTQDIIASVLGLSRWSVNKALATFKECGWIKIERGKLTILKPNDIRNYAYRANK